jgi:hypothetical protein
LVSTLLAAGLDQLPPVVHNPRFETNDKEHATMGHRSDRFRIRSEDAIATKAVNSVKKKGERARRRERMIERMKGGGLPFTPEVMSWLSRETGKKSTLITDADVKSIIST